ncbi:hypothetical protein PA7_38790 [Pseudonocardia asaccharolytica DSM 44247 = NBRC 16224]|uniref:Uncharacterized protein n=1 Tax=Pseudonocardia asaccharolytica DSM 44247 = NBRC 16224 TaxID=1123024 RepID=A0A511D5G7_9PSEU|nr:hypothetical protein PA7_38790 [Pseudonocardia asaccharolytica DSM 44247 = NBRC 16224]
MAARIFTPGTSSARNGRDIAADISAIRGHEWRRMRIHSAIATVMFVAITIACTSVGPATSGGRRSRGSVAAGAAAAMCRRS